ncbi:MAG: phosphotransferase [Aeromicrobium sp.]
MNSVPWDDNEVPLPGGNVGGATQVGRTVRRPTGPWTPAVHELLDYLREQGLRGIPDVLGIDEQGRESLSYLEGRGVQVDNEIVLDNVLEEAVVWLRDFHDLVDGFRPDGSRVWRSGEAVLDDGQIICHNDPGAYNWIIQSGHFVAMIDWDVAGPGKPIDDLAFLAWTALPLYRETPVDDLVRRLDILVDAYGEWGPMTILNAVVERMTTASDRIAAGQDRGDVGMLNLAKVGEPERTRDRVEAFRARLPEIESAL